MEFEEILYCCAMLLIFILLISYLSSQKTKAERERKVAENQLQPYKNRISTLEESLEEQRAVIIEQQAIIEQLRRDNDALRVMRQNRESKEKTAVYQTPPVRQKPVQQRPPKLSFEQIRALPQVIEREATLKQYMQRAKNEFDVGMEYERFVGYRYEMQGCIVEYTGINKGRRDAGCDLLIRKNGNLIVVQCKRWRQGKQVREKHILQLHGTVAIFQSKFPQRHVYGVLVTTASLSPEAKEYANRLGVEIRENFQFEPYPLIKCVSISSRKIYYLPCDSQYDNVSCSMHCDDIYVETVAEAEFLGYTHVNTHT